MGHTTVVVACPNYAITTDKVRNDCAFIAHCRGQCLGGRGQGGSFESGVDVAKPLSKSIFRLKGDMDYSRQKVSGMRIFGHPHPLFPLPSRARETQAKTGVITAVGFFADTSFIDGSKDS